jgi:hypothetical protein
MYTILSCHAAPQTKIHNSTKVTKTEDFGKRIIRATNASAALIIPKLMTDRKTDRHENAP